MISAKIKDTDVHIGDLLRVSTQVQEGDRVRVQVFEGILIRLRGRSSQDAFSNQTFTVRRIGVGAIGIERTWPIDSKTLVKIEVKKKVVKVRRSKLYYLRDKTGKEAVRV